MRCLRAGLAAAPHRGRPGATPWLDEVEAFRISSTCGIAGSVQDETGRALADATVTARLRRGADEMMVAIDGVSTAGFGVRGARALLAGPVGTQVSLSLIGADGTAYTAAVDRLEAPDLGPP